MCSLAWFSEGPKVPIRTMCLVNLSIGKVYRYQVWCAIAPLNMCHILLDRLWQFDREIMHNGKKNTIYLRYEWHRNHTHS